MRVPINRHQITSILEQNQAPQLRGYSGFESYCLGSIDLFLLNRISLILLLWLLLLPIVLFIRYAKELQAQVVVLYLCGRLIDLIIVALKPTCPPQPLKVYSDVHTLDVPNTLEKTIIYYASMIGPLQNHLFLFSCTGNTNSFFSTDML